jgi:hypothetical protein
MVLSHIWKYKLIKHSNSIIFLFSAPTRRGCYSMWTLVRTQSITWGWPLNTGLTVQRWPLNTGLTVQRWPLNTLLIFKNHFDTSQLLKMWYKVWCDCLIEVTTWVDLTTFVIKGLIQLTGSEWPVHFYKWLLNRGDYMGRFDYICNKRSDTIDRKWMPCTLLQVTA